MANQIDTRPADTIKVRILHASQETFRYRPPVEEAVYHDVFDFDFASEIGALAGAVELEQAMHTILNNLFEWFNVGDDPDFYNPPIELAVEYRKKRNRSLSVSDVVIIGEVAYQCASVGWTIVNINADQIVERPEL